MSPTTTSDQVGRLTKLPAVTTSGAPELTSNSVSIFKDSNWTTSMRLDILLDEYTANQRQRIPTSIFDQATWVAFNLPLGTVMTMTDNPAEIVPGRKVSDLSNCGKSVDLVGTGKTETVDLKLININDCISSFFYRTVDFSLGAIELFADSVFTGPRVTVFFSEWNQGQVVSLANWYIEDQVSSIRWTSLNDRQTVILYEHPEGAGATYSNIKGWGATKELPHLKDINLNDKISAFRWDGIKPMKEIIKPFDIISTPASGVTSLTAHGDGENDSPATQSQSLEITNTNTQSVAVTTTDRFVQGITTSLETSWTLGPKDTASASQKWTISMNFTYEHTESTTQTGSQAVALAYKQPISIPTYCTWYANLAVNVGRLPPKTYSTTADRWYLAPITGGIADPANNGWYKRTETVSLAVQGSLACGTWYEFKSTPLPGKPVGSK